jgi:hypothetical protein
MGVTRVDSFNLPKRTLEYNLPGGTSRSIDDFINIPIPATTESGSYPAWVAARKTKSFILW